MRRTAPSERPSNRGVAQLGEPQTDDGRQGRDARLARGARSALGRASRKVAPGMRTKSWPCKSNSVCLGSSPRASKRVGAFGLSAGVLARRASPTTLLLGAAARAFSPDPVRLGLPAEPEPLADLRHEASHGPTLRFGCFSREPKLAWPRLSPARNRREGKPHVHRAFEVGPPGFEPGTNGL